MIEQESVAQKNYTDYAQVEQGLQRIENEISKQPAIGGAMWSTSYHHGMDTLYSSQMKGMGFIPLFESSDTNGRRKYSFARSFEGRWMVALEGRIPNGNKPYYEVDFFIDQLKLPAQ